ncbi:MAG: hypothetical protein FWD68_03725 [Alphaproteobacteria bacterium]|nr:hypothetical protein [Alphaproteobacteria bacterium]
MASQLSFSVAGREFSVTPAKVDRRKLYGWAEVHAFDDDGAPCTLVSTDQSGTIIIPKGGIGLGIVGADGNWVERSSLKTVTADGEAAALIPSSFSKANVLVKAQPEELLDCSITAFYHLAGEDGLIDAIGTDIYRFDYCYRDSYETSPAFLLTTEQAGDKTLFMLVGRENAFEFIGLAEIAVAEEASLEDEDEDDDAMDFSMF